MIKVPGSQFEIKESDINIETLDPSFRKATLNMIAAHSVCKQTLDQFNLLNNSENSNKTVSFILATYFGEVSTSLEFLTTLHESKIAKPILFQNSLHNSTLGFVSIQLGLTGPAITISADEKTEDSILYTAYSLLQLTDYVLVCQVDMVPEFLKKYYNISFPKIEHSLCSASSYLLTKKK